MPKRRSGSDELRNALLSLVRTTLDQVGVVRDAAMKQASTQRMAASQVLLARRKKDRLAALGAEVYELLLRGELAELAEGPCAGIIADLIDIDEQMDDEDAGAAGDGPANWDKSRARHGLDRGSEAPVRHAPARVWRPNQTISKDVAEHAPAHAKDSPPRAPIAGARKGGIHFVTDEPAAGDQDLADYMHEDDIPND